MFKDEDILIEFTEVQEEKEEENLKEELEKQFLIQKETMRIDFEAHVNHQQ